MHKLTAVTFGRIHLLKFLPYAAQNAGPVASVQLSLWNKYTQSITSRFETGTGGAGGGGGFSKHLAVQAAHAGLSSMAPARKQHLSEKAVRLAQTIQ
jgi:hypothetical protein